MDEYEVLFRCRLFHKYYKEMRCRGMDVFPSGKTMMVMRGHRLVWKKMDVNEWVLIGCKGTQWDEDEPFVWNIKVMEPLLWCVTDELEMEQEIRMQLKEGDAEKTIELNYKSKRLRWEYLFVGRDREKDLKLELMETTGQLNFEEMKVVEFMGKRAFRTISREVVELCEGYDYQLRLVERRELGKRILMKNIDFPIPGRFISDNDCVRQVVFY